MYNSIKSGLIATGIPFAEYEWATRPSSDYGVYEIDFEADALRGDDLKLETSYRGSVDLFLHKPDAVKVKKVEDVLVAVCGGAWQLNSIQYENSTRLLHYEWEFYLEAM